MSPCEWSQMWPNSAPSQAAQRGRRAISQLFLKTAGVGQACIESYGHVYGATVSIVTDAKMSGEDGREGGYRGIARTCTQTSSCSWKLEMSVPGRSSNSIPNTHATNCARRA